MSRRKFLLGFLFRLTHVTVSAQISVGGGYSFTSDYKRGAVAVLEDGGTQEAVSRSTAFHRYIALYHQSWYNLARKREIDLEVEDIVLVSGWIKTSGWSLATYASRGRSHAFSLSIGATGVASADGSMSFEEKTRMGLQKRSGPERSSSKATPPQDQCVFLQYYKCTNRGPGLKAIKNAQNLRRGDIREKVADHCICTPFVAIVDWVRSCCGCCRVKEEDPSERVRFIFTYCLLGSDG